MASNILSARPLTFSGVGDYIPNNLGVDSIAVGFYKGKDLCYAARVRAGFVPPLVALYFRQSSPLRRANAHL